MIKLLKRSVVDSNPPSPRLHARTRRPRRLTQAVRSEPEKQMHISLGVCFSLSSACEGGFGARKGLPYSPQRKTSAPEASGSKHQSPGPPLGGHAKATEARQAGEVNNMDAHRIYRSALCGVDLLTR